MTKEEGERQILEIGHGSGRYGEARRLREAVLRAPLGLTLAGEPPEREADFRHFGVVCGEALLACLMVVGRGAGGVQIRQMAVCSGCRGRGLGRFLLEGVEERLTGEGVRGVYLHARLEAEGFYGRLGYRRTGPGFEEVGIVHCRMEKELAGAVGNPFEEA
ncbi:MAG: GNAT family N-acetyltransferase [Oceanipulchritudo sp.]